MTQQWKLELFVEKKKLELLALMFIAYQTDFPNLIKYNVFLLWCINISITLSMEWWLLLKIKL